MEDLPIFVLFKLFGVLFQLFIRIKFRIPLIAAASFQYLSKLDNFWVIALNFSFIRNVKAFNKILIEYSDLLDLSCSPVQIFGSFFLKMRPIPFYVFFNHFSHFHQLILIRFVFWRYFCQNYAICRNLIDQLVHHIQKVVWVVTKIQVTLMINSGSLKLTYILVHQATVMNQTNCFIELYESTQKSLCVGDWTNVDFIFLPFAQFSLIWRIWTVLSGTCWSSVSILKNLLNFIWLSNSQLKGTFVLFESRHIQRW